MHVRYAGKMEQMCASCCFLWIRAGQERHSAASDTHYRDWSGSPPELCAT